MSTEQAKAVCAICGHKMTGTLTSHPDHLVTPTDTSELRALQEAMRREKPHYPEWIDARYVLSAALLYAADDLLDELDQLRGQVARVEAWYGWRRGTDAPDEALAAPAEGGE